MDMKLKIEFNAFKDGVQAWGNLRGERCFQCVFNVKSDLTLKKGEKDLSSIYRFSFFFGRSIY